MRASARTAIASTMVTTSATQPIAIDAPTAPNELLVSDPEMRSYALMKTGRMMITVNARMTAMMHRSAAG